MDKLKMKIKDIKQDDKNANKGTARGYGMLEHSLQQHGFGRSILLDKNNKIIAGNKTAEIAGSIGLENVRVIESDGKDIIAVRRTDLDLDKDASAKALAIADNRVSEVSLAWDTSQLAEIGKDIDLSAFFTTQETSVLIPKDPDVAVKKTDEKNEYEVQVKILYFKPADWMEYKNKIINFLFENKIDYRIDEDWL